MEDKTDYEIQKPDGHEFHRICSVVSIIEIGFGLVTFLH